MYNANLEKNLIKKARWVWLYFNKIKKCAITCQITKFRKHIYRIKKKFHNEWMFACDIIILILYLPKKWGPLLFSLWLKKGMNLDIKEACNISMYHNLAVFKRVFIYLL